MNAGAVVDPTHRPLGLETDMANPNFAGARNPDDLLWVQFKVVAVPDNYNSQSQGKPAFIDEIWIEIRTPGQALNIIERPMMEEDKRRFPRQWAWFQQTHQDDGQNVGTPLTQWPLLRPSQIESMKALKFYTVEQLAFASDQQIQALGMAGGMAPLALRERAKLYLESAKDNALAVKQAEEIKKRDQTITDLMARLEKLEAEQQPAQRETLHAKKGA